MALLWEHGHFVGRMAMRNNIVVNTIRKETAIVEYEGKVPIVANEKPSATAGLEKTAGKSRLGCTYGCVEPIRCWTWRCQSKKWVTRCWTVLATIIIVMATHHFQDHVST
jgi:hypothetical protein